MFKDKIVKLGDFGFCKQLEHTGFTKTKLGSPLYMAPEILNGQEYNSQADIWSLGILVYEMLYGYCPYEGQSILHIQELQQKDVEFDNQMGVSKEIIMIINKML